MEQSIYFFSSPLRRRDVGRRRRPDYDTLFFIIIIRFLLLLFLFFPSVLWGGRKLLFSFKCLEKYQFLYNDRFSPSKKKEQKPDTIFRSQTVNYMIPLLF